MEAGAIRIVDEYATADIKRRIEIILDNYPNFQEIMDGYEESLKFLIINDRRVSRRKGREELVFGFRSPASAIRRQMQQLSV